MPKRKLPRIWYSKNDYKKEHENETDKVSESIQKDNNTQSTVTNKTAIQVNNNIQPNDLDNTLSVGNVSQPPQTEDESKVTPTNDEGNLQQNETPATSSDTQVQASDKDNKVQIEPKNDIAPMEIGTQQTLFESDSKHQLTEKETQETSQIDNIVPPTDGPEKQALIELRWTKVQDKLADPLTRPDPEQVAPPTESLEEVTLAEVENKIPLTDSVENIEKYTDSLKRLLPTKAVICIGEYPINIFLKGSFADKKDGSVLPIFVEKSSKDVIKWSGGRLDLNNIACLDEDIDTHFWYDILPYVVENGNIFASLKSKPIEKLQGAIAVSSTWSGIGSALLPALYGKLKELKINSIGLAILPSKAQPLDGQLNSFASIGICASKESTTLVLIDRDNLENYNGIDRNGYNISGNISANYLLDLMLTKETFVQELTELSKSFSSKMFTVLLASGVSMKIYGSLENMLNTTLLRPLFTFDLSSSTLLYVLIRMPFHLKDKLPRGNIELTITNWFKDKANLESIYVTDPVYTDDGSDRMDIALFVGGFDIATRFVALEKRVEKMKNKAVKKGSITEEDWQAIAKSLTE